MRTNSFPHLVLTSHGKFKPKFAGGYKRNPEVEEILADRVSHVTRIHGILDKMREDDAALRKERAQSDLPDVPANKDFLLRVPEGTDVDGLAQALGVELVAETNEGLILVSSEDLSFTLIERVLKEFATESGAKVHGSSILDIYDESDDPRRLENILSPEVLQLWPLEDNTEYIFDVGLQTALSTRNVKWPKVRRKQTESPQSFSERQEQLRENVRREADEEWLQNADERVTTLLYFVSHYGGQELSGYAHDPQIEDDKGIIFPDSVQIRVKLNGRGFRDVILNVPHIFEVTLPPEVENPVRSDTNSDVPHNPEIHSPDESAPAVCVIDSGIQEDHRLLQPAIDKETSRCFLPEYAADNVADYFPPKGHGTAVAGAILYPREIPISGAHEPVAWIQNARVLNEDNQLPESLQPERYLQKVVDHFTNGHRNTKIYNHSINARVPCPRKRMTAWAAKLDQLSHEKDVLFIQSVGNLEINSGAINNPGVNAHLEAGRQHPDHLLEQSSRVANPGQSLHALTVGSICNETYDDEYFSSFSTSPFSPSAFSRAGYAPPWDAVKPEVVEIGGDLLKSKDPPYRARVHPSVSLELVNSTRWGAPAYSRDQVGTSFAAPKVAHIAAHLQSLFPNESPLLYRTLIVHSARWPEWAEQANGDNILRLIGYGLPSIERATENSEHRVTLITPDAVSLSSKTMDVYSIRIPSHIRSAAQEARIRVDVTLAYTAVPRRTRARRTGYLETWLDWQASKVNESLGEFLDRMQNGGSSRLRSFRWHLNTQNQFGEVDDTNRNRGTVQKDWTIFEAHNLPSEFAVAVRAHIGWNHLDGAASARYCLAVTLEALEGTLPIYSAIQNPVEIEQPQLQLPLSLSI